jgi:hypothetical protein
MFSGATLTAINDDIAAQAAQKGLYPYVPFNAEELDRGESWLRLIPNIGYYEPPSWEEVDHVQVDKTGLDKSGPALTSEQAVAWARKLIEEGKATGFAWIEEGQFQIYLGAFVKKF